MPQVNLKSITAAGKSVVGQVSGAIENIAGAAGQGAFSVNVGPNGVTISANFNEVLKNTVRGNRTSSQIKSLYAPNGGKVYRPIIYPDDIDDDHYMIFNVIERKRDNRKEKGTTRVIRSIVLPIPLNLTTQYNAEYQNESLGIFGAMAAGRINAADLKSAVGDISNIISSKIQAASDAFKAKDLDAGVRAAGIAGPAVVTGAAAAGAGAVGGLLALGGTSGGVISGVGVSEGLAINPHMAVLFQGVGFREHSFSYKLLARNLEESIRIKELISVFKYHMHPNYKIGNLAFEYPDEFEIEFSTKLQPYMYKVGTCVLKSFNVSYSTEGTNAFYDSGAPVSLEISMTFQETKIITKDTLDDPNFIDYGEAL
jgi:hypothetical protein